MNECAAGATNHEIPIASFGGEALVWSDTDGVWGGRGPCEHLRSVITRITPVCTAIAPLQVQRGAQAQQLAHVRLAYAHACVRICLRVCANCYPFVTRARDHLFTPKVPFVYKNYCFRRYCGSVVCVVACRRSSDGTLLRSKAF